MLSIIIISKDEEKTLPRLLRSIKAQDYKDYEIILSDAFSKDKTRKIAKEYGCKIVNGGLPSKGRNNGAKIAKGDILLFLDSDTMLPKDFLKDNLKEFNKRKLVTAGIILKPLSNKISAYFVHLIYNMFSRMVQFMSPHAGGCCIFCRKDIFQKLKGFNEMIKIAEDHDFVKRSKKYGKFRILKSKQLFLDIRRLEKEGIIGITKKFIIIDLYRLFKGEIKNSPIDYEMQGINIKKLDK